MATRRFIAKNGLDNNNQTITNVASPVNTTDAVNKSITDGILSYAQSAYGLANAVSTVNSTQNTNITNVNTLASAAYNAANTAASNTVYQSGVDTTQNTNITNVNTLAQSAFNTANVKFNTSGGNITGAVTISSNLTVTGNLTVSGNVTTVSANNLMLKDNMIYLNDGSTVANPDLGIAGNYNDGVYRHAGFFRDASDGYWKVYDQYLPEPDASPYIDTSNTSFRIADFQANNVTFGKITTSSSLSVTNLNADYLDGQHGSYYTTAGNLSGTIPSAVLGNSTAYVGTTAIALNRASGSQSLTGVSIDGTASNITAYTINQNVGSSNTPTFAGVSLSTTNPSAAAGVVPSFATMNGGRSYAGYDFNGQPYLYETRFVNLSASTNVPAGMSGMGYWFGMGAGDVSTRGFSLVGTSGSGMWYKEHSGSSWYRFLDSSNYTSYSPSLTGTGASGTWGISITGSAGSISTSTNQQLNSLGVGTAASGTAGEIRATNTITAYYSDERLKNIISTIPNALDKTLSLSGVLFTQNEKAEEFGYNNYEQQVGVIAQQVQKVLPEAIRPAPFDIDENNESISGENYMTVQYEKLVPLLIESIKEQQKQIDELRTIIKEINKG